VTFLFLGLAAVCWVLVFLSFYPTWPFLTLGKVIVNEGKKVKSILQPKESKEEVRQIFRSSKDHHLLLHHPHHYHQTERERERAAQDRKLLIFRLTPVAALPPPLSSSASLLLLQKKGKVFSLSMIPLSSALVSSVVK